MKDEKSWDWQEFWEGVKIVAGVVSLVAGAALTIIASSDAKLTEDQKNQLDGPSLEE